MTYDDTKSEQHHGPQLKLYYTVFAALAVLTVLTVAVSRLHLAPAPAVVIALMIAVSKASLVAAFFMHLKYDSKALHLMVAVPTLLTCLMLMALMPDIGMAHGPLVAGPPEQRAQVIARDDGEHESKEANPAEDGITDQNTAGEEKTGE